MLFRAGGERFALPLEAVSEVVTPEPPFVRVPRAPASVRGAMNLRGRVVAVVELSFLVGLDGERLPDGRGQVLVLDRERHGLGFLVDGVLGVEPVPALERPGAGPPVRGLATVRDAPVAVLDPDLLSEVAHRLFGGKATPAG